MGQFLIFIVGDACFLVRDRIRPGFFRRFGFLAILRKLIGYLSANRPIIRGIYRYIYVKGVCVSVAADCSEPELC